MTGCLANPWSLRKEGEGPGYGQKVAAFKERSELKLGKQ